QGFLSVLRRRHLHRAGLPGGGLRRDRLHGLLPVSGAQFLGLPYSPRLAARFSTFSQVSAGLSPTREYSCLRLISVSAASRSALVVNQWVRCHSPPLRLRNGS